MAELPAGTVTFLFTDIEGSTRALADLGDAYADTLEEHRRTLRKVFAEHDGVEVDTQGDAFFVAFARASDAARAALASQTALARTRLRVRMGLHTGEPLTRGGGYVGMDVHRGARVMSAGHGGQIVVSERTGALLDDKFPLRDLGAHRLKDLGGAEHLYQLGEGEFPPLRTIDATNLPLAATQLLGRDHELAELVALLEDESRVVTITGPGGTGKTRLALEVAASFVGRTADGVAWIPLAGVPSAELVPAEIAQAVGAGDDLDGFLRKRTMLLLLDNLEHVLEVAPALSALLSTAPKLKLLLTSRAALRIAGEHEYPLEPLSPRDSVTLFCERARAGGREVEPDATVEEICRRLDGLPLAIELAASRTRLLSAGALLERLGRRLPLLTGGARDAPERQRTLRGTIEWSYELLDDEAKQLFARLAVFAGSFSLDASEAICEASLDSLSALVDLSLLKSTAEDRFLLLETIREYAAERFDELDDGDGIRGRHAEFFLALAHEAYRNRIDHEAEWAAKIQLEHDDLRAALDWLTRIGDVRELSLAGALGWFWLSHSHLEEGASRLEHALRLAAAPSAESARALAAAGGIASRTGRAEEAQRLSLRALDEWRATGDDTELAATLHAFGWSSFFSADNEESMRAFEEELSLQRGRQDKSGETRALVGVCQLLVAQHRVDEAEALSRELLGLSRAHNDVRSEHFALHFLADCALMRHDYGEAQRRYRDSLEAAVALGDSVETSLEIQGVAMASASAGEREYGVRLAAAVEAFWESIGLEIDVPFWTALLESHIAAARAELGATDAAIWSEGRALGLDDAVALALAGP